MGSRHSSVQASDNPTLDADGRSCRNGCNWLIGDKPPLGWHSHADNTSSYLRVRHSRSVKILSMARPAPIHADLDLFALQALQIFGAGEMTALVAIPDFGLGLQQGIVHSREYKIHFQGLAERPADDIAGIPVQNRGKIEPAMLEADVGNIDAPDVIGMRCGHVSQQVRVNRVLRGGFTRMGTWHKGKNAHFAHIRLHRGARNTKFRAQQEGDFPRAIERAGGVDFIDPPLDRQLTRPKAAQVHRTDSSN